MPILYNWQSISEYEVVLRISKTQHIWDSTDNNCVGLSQGRHWLKSWAGSNHIEYNWQEYRTWLWSDQQETLRNAAAKRKEYQDFI